MIVNLSFDTEKDSLEDFRKLRAYVDGIISEREGAPKVRSEASANPVKERTSGGCRVIPYKDLSDELFSLCSRKR